MSWSQLVQTEKEPKSRHQVAVAPSVLSANFASLESEIRAAEAAGAEFLHLDVMDGHFVPNLTFGPMLVDAIHRVSTVSLDTHLMIEHPDRYISNFIDAGSDIVTIHVEASADVAKDLAEIRMRGAKCGLALNPDTEFEDIEKYLEDIDLLLVMSVFPGFGGQKFIETVIPKVERAAGEREQRGLGFAIEIDGGITAQTAVRARDAGVDVLVAGTAIFGTDDYVKAVGDIRG